MKPIPAFTIASNNYLALARVFAESYREHHPGVQVFVCIADRPHPAVPYDQMPFTSIFVHELDIPCFDNFAFRYNILEMNTAVKPFALAYLRDRLRHDRVFYFDPDILIHDRLTGLAEALDRADVVLTPHITRPLGDDRLPSERSILRAGIYNLGFLGIRFNQRTSEFLEWWKDRLYRFCLIDPSSGLFVDQSWMALAPALLESAEIVRDPIYNIAYWNLAHRQVSIEEGRWMVDGRRVGFFHFSGIDLEDIESVSRHQDRLSLDRRPDIRPCFEHYRDLVYNAGYEDSCDLPYGYDRFHNTDVRIPRTARWALQRIDPEGRRWRKPFDVEDEDSYYRWLVEPLSYSRGALTRLALSLWEERSDLIQAFPRVTEEDLPSYVGWLRNAHKTGEIDALFLEGVHWELPPEFTISQAVETLLGLVHLGKPLGLAEWLNRPYFETSRHPTITRFVMILWQTRSDLQKLFRDPEDHDRVNFAKWFVTHGQHDYRLPPVLVEPVLSTVGPEILEIVESFQIAKASQSISDLTDLGRPSELAAWANEPASSAADRRPLITRLAMTMHGMRPDLQLKFPDPLGEDRVGFARWFIRRGRREYRLHPALVTPVERSLTSEEEDADLRGGTERPESAKKPDRPAPMIATAPRRRIKCFRGVNLGGYFDAGSGVGQMGRSSASVLANTGLPFVRVPLDQDFSEKTIRNMIHPACGMPYPVTLLNANADETPWAIKMMPRTVTEKSYKIGYWYWELSHFPLAFADRFPLLDEIWAPTQFCWEAYEAISPIPVRLIPPFVPPPAPGRVDKLKFGLDEDRFIFFYAFDAGSISERKNPSAAIEALRRLRLETPRRVGLLLKINRGWLEPELITKLRQQALGLPISFYTKSASRETVESMLATCDAILSLHRSEGLGLLPIEGLYLGKPVIGTAYGGVTDYLDQETGFPVEYELRMLERDYPPYPRGSVWADPSVDHAVAQMREVLENPQEAARRTAAGKRRILERYGLEAASKRFVSELNRIFDRLDERPESYGQPMPSS